jgi:hypothetical protein
VPVYHVKLAINFLRHFPVLLEHPLERNTSIRFFLKVINGFFGVFLFEHDVKVSVILRKTYLYLLCNYSAVA